MTAARARRLVDSVLDYLEKRQKSAALRGERIAALLLTEAWQIVYENFYGRVRAVKQDVPKHLPEPTIEERRNLKWFREKYAKPLRRVVREVEYSTQDADTGHTQHWYGQQLECGHTVMNQFDSPGTKRRKQIRCGACVTGEAKGEVFARDAMVQ